LQITEARVSNLLEQAAMLELREDQSNLLIADEVLFMLQNTRQSLKDIREGKIRLYIPNKVTKAAVTAYLAKNKSIPDLSFSQNVMTVRLIDLLPENSSDKLIKALEKLASEANSLEISKELESVVKKANAKSGLEKIQHVATASLKVFLGTGGEYLSNEFFDIIKSIIKE
jgi:translation elongation factor EF-G